MCEYTDYMHREKQGHIDKKQAFMIDLLFINGI